MYSKTPTTTAVDDAEIPYHLDGTLTHLFGLTTYAGQILRLSQKINDRLYGVSNDEDNQTDDVLVDHDPSGMLERINWEIGSVKEILQAIEKELEKLKMI